VTFAENTGNISPTVSIVLVPPSQLDEVWTRASKLIELSQRRTSSYEGMEDIYDALAAKQRQLWIVMVEDKLKAAAVTAIEQHPRKRILRILHIGGRDMHMWQMDGLEALKFAAKHSKCDAIQGDARLGWVRKIPENTFKEVSRVYEMEI